MAKTDIDSAFLKPDTTWKELIIKEIIPQESVKMRPSIKIKIEVDATPPPGIDTEEKLLLIPYSFYVKCFTLQDIFAGKMHALLFRANDITIWVDDFRNGYGFKIKATADYNQLTFSSSATEHNNYFVAGSTLAP